MNRRMFLSATPAMLGAGALSAAETRPQAPVVTRPRATFGDEVEPNWEQRVKISVGPGKADLVGADHRAIQAAVDYVAGLGGGTVQILPGTYRFRNAVKLRSGVRIAGSGLDSVCIKEPSVKTPLLENSDWYDREVTLADPSGFEVGDGIVLRTRNPHNGSHDTYKRTLIARSGNRFKLDEMLVENFWTKENASAATLFALFDGYRIADTVIENICLDGNRSNNEALNGNYVGCIFLRESNRIQMRQVTARNFNGDGISWQVCHDVRVEDCHSHDNAGFALHPGSGSQRTVVTGSTLERNDIGFFFCWGVKWALVENNRMLDNKRFGVSIGHNDTDNVVRNNEVLRSGKTGIFLRQEHGPTFSPSRNRIEANRVLDSGAEDGVAIDIEGTTEEVILKGNTLAETRQPASRIGVRIGKETKQIELAENRINGFSTPVLDLSK
ncbi:MAG: right-handed parallel beta-helix repeat-containing protein [Bryobacterales bacterium]|nr:right-handed parallel beta-helix repeat-containing protein [Bryobacterales bacterium]